MSTSTTVKKKTVKRVAVKKTVRAKTVKKKSVAKVVKRVAKKENVKAMAWHDHLHRFIDPIVPKQEPPVAVSLFVVALFSLAVGAGLTWFAMNPAYVGEGALVADVSTSKTYYSSDSNFAVTYPAGWQANTFLLNSEHGAVESVVLEGEAHTMVIYTADTVTADTIVPTAPTFSSVGGREAFRYRDIDPATGTPLYRVVVKNQNGVEHELQGYGPAFERMLASFRFTK